MDRDPVLSVTPSLPCLLFRQTPPLSFFILFPPTMPCFFDPYPTERFCRGGSTSERVSEGLPLMTDRLDKNTVGDTCTDALPVFVASSRFDPPMCSPSSAGASASGSNRCARLRCAAAAPNKPALRTSVLEGTPVPFTINLPSCVCTCVHVFVPCLFEPAEGCLCLPPVPYALYPA